MAMAPPHAQLKLYDNGSPLYYRRQLADILSAVLGFDAAGTVLRDLYLQLSMCTVDSLINGIKDWPFAALSVPYDTKMRLRELCAYLIFEGILGDLWSMTTDIILDGFHTFLSGGNYYHLSADLSLCRERC